MEVARQQTGDAFYRQGHEERILLERMLAAERQMKHEDQAKSQNSPSSVSDNDSDEKRSSEDERHPSGVEQVASREEKRKVAYVETSLDDLIYSDHDEVEASGQSEDEENERRLIERLKLENQQRQMHQLEQQQQQQLHREELARQQQRQQKAAAQKICFHDASASLQRPASGTQQPAADKATSESECADGPAPQVPVRRSSRQASLVHPIGDNCRAPVYSLHHRRLIGLKARGRPALSTSGTGRERESEDEDQEGELDYEVEDDDDDEKESLLPPPPRLHAVGPGVLASAAARPPLPPPPPPAPLAVDSSRRGKHPPPPPPPRTRSVQQAPKNIWSPSSSSLASSSLSSEPELELDPAPLVATQALVSCVATGTGSEAANQRSMTQREQGHMSIGQSNKGPSDSRSNEEDEEDEQATIVERHLEANAANLSDEKTGAGCENELLHQTNKQANGNRNHGTTSIKAAAAVAGDGASSSSACATMALAVAVAGNKSDDGKELPLPPPPPIEQQEQEGNLQLAKENVRSFSISSPTNLTTSQRQQLATASHQLSPAGRAAAAANSRLSSFVGGPSAGRSTNRSPAGQMRSFSIAAPSDRIAPRASGQRVEWTKGACQPEQTRREQTEEATELGGDDADDKSMQQAHIAIERTLQPLQQQQQQLERTEEQAGRVQQATRQDHTAASTRTVTADRVAGPALGREQITKQNKDKRQGPITTSIEREMASPVRPDQPELDSADDENLLFYESGKNQQQRLETTKETYQGRQQTTTTTFTKSKILTNSKSPQVEQRGNNTAGPKQPVSKEEWFKQMYKQMHRPAGATMTAEKSLLDAVNQASQRDQADGSMGGCIKIKLKSPRSDHHQEPSYFSEEDLERRSASPGFSGTKPGNICDYLPGQSSISQHERNLLLYHKLIDHINRVFSSVLVQQQEAGVAATSRSTNALASLHKPACHHHHHQSAYYEADDLRARSHSMRRTSRTRRRSSSGGGGRAGTLKRRKQLAQSRSGPQTPAPATTNKQTTAQTTCSPAYHIRSTRLNDETTTTTATSGDEHERRCVFNRLLLKDDNQQRAYESDHRDQQEQAIDLNDDDDDDGDEDGERAGRLPRDPRKQYVAVQQGHDIPLKGLRKPAPQPNIYRVGPAPPVPKLSLDDNQLARQQYREHNLRLAQTLGRPSNSRHSRHQFANNNNNNSMPRRRNVVADTTNDDRHVEDLYRDFESIYSHLCATKPMLAANGAGSKTNGPGEVDDGTTNSAVWSSEAKFETMALDESLADVERALGRASRDYARRVEGGGEGGGGGGGGPGGQPVIIVSPNPSERTSTTATSCGGGGGRADSRNTERSLQLNGGPALVEEMTLSDLEDEICSTLMAAKDAERQRRYQRLLEGGSGGQRRSSPARVPAQSAQFLQAGEQLLNGRRSRAPISNAISSTFKSSQGRRF